MAARDRCLESLSVITLLWPTLLAARQPGTAQDGSSSPPGIEQARSLRAERAEVGSAGGTVEVYAAPCDLSVVLAIADVEFMLSVAHDQLLAMQKLPRLCNRCRHDIKQHSRSSGSRCDACQRCEGFRLVRVASDARAWRELLVDEDAATAVQFRIDTARGKVEEALNLILAGKLITALCPWCNGITESMPGGSFTLRVFMPGGAPDMYVMCLNAECDPPSDACGYRSNGHPYWPYAELDWLAKRLESINFKQRRTVVVHPAVVVAAVE